MNSKTNIFGRINSFILTGTLVKAEKGKIVIASDDEVILILTGDLDCSRIQEESPRVICEGKMTTKGLFLDSLKAFDVISGKEIIAYKNMWGKYKDDYEEKT